MSHTHSSILTVLPYMISSFTNVILRFILIRQASLLSVNQYTFSDKLIVHPLSKMFKDANGDNSKIPGRKI